MVSALPAADTEDHEAGKTPKPGAYAPRCDDAPQHSWKEKRDMCDMDRFHISLRPRPHGCRQLVSSPVVHGHKLTTWWALAAPWPPCVLKVSGKQRQTLK